MRDRHALPHGLLDQVQVHGRKMNLVQILPTGETIIISGPFSEELGAAFLATAQEKEPDKKFAVTPA